MKYLLQLDDQSNIIVSKTTTDDDFPLTNGIVFVNKEIFLKAKPRFHKYINGSLVDIIPVDHIDDSGTIRQMTPQEKVTAGIESIDQYRNPVIQSIVNEMNEREKPLLDKYSNGQRLSFPTRKRESMEWLALPTSDRTVSLAQTNFSLLYQIVTIENGIINPVVDDITNVANSIKEKVIIFEQTLTILSNKKDLLIGKPEILDANNVVIAQASGVYALTVDELINYGDVKTRWDS